MTVAYDDGWARLLHGDCRDVLRSLPDASVHCVVTSPPYYGLRNYSIAPSIWDSEGGCDHEWGSEERGRDILPPEESSSTSRMGSDERQGVGAQSGGRFCRKCSDHEHDWYEVVKPAHGIINSAMQGATLSGNSATRSPQRSHMCGCGAWLGSLGNEPTPSLYIAHLVQVFREVRRVLRDDGVCFCNIGDSYAGSGGPGGDYGEGGIRAGQPRWKAAFRAKRAEGGDVRGMGVDDAKPKDLLGVPWMLAFALRADGWFLRSEIIWSKTSAMPESVEDRPTRAHEQIFMLAKSGDTLYWTHRDKAGARERPAPDYRWVNAETGDETTEAPEGWTPKNRKWLRRNLWKGHDYFYDSHGYREASTGQTGAAADFKRNTKEDIVPGQGYLQHRTDRKARVDTGTANLRDTWLDTPGGKQAQVGNRRYTGFNDRWDATEASGNAPATANLRDTWLLGPDPVPEAHFAVFVRELPRRCILLGTSGHGVCSKCKAPHERVLSVEETPPRIDYEGKNAELPSQSSHRRLLAGVHGARAQGGDHDNPFPSKATVGWRATCSCDAAVEPAVVLDPFAGSGTTLLVAKQLGRRSIGIELSGEYVEIAKKRVSAVPLPMEVGV